MIAPSEKAMLVREEERLAEVEKRARCRAVLLYSGGLDSTTLLYWALWRFKEVIPLNFDYGQRHRIENVLARKGLDLAQSFLKLQQGMTCKKLHRFHQLEVNLRGIGGSSLTDDTIDVGKDRTLAEMKSTVPQTYVPFRNGIFLAHATAFAEVQNANYVIGGWNALDFSGYPDCRDSFLDPFAQAALFGTTFENQADGFQILRPLIDLNKRDIVQLGLTHSARYDYSYSCYEGAAQPCGRCDSCILRAHGFNEAGEVDHYLERLRRDRAKDPA